MNSVVPAYACMQANVWNRQEIRYRGDGDAYPGGDAGGERHGHGVHEAGGLDEHPGGANCGGGVGEVAGEHGDDLVPPPLEADADAAGHGEAGEGREAGGDVGGARPALPGVLAGARPAHVGEQEEQHVGVGERLRRRDAAHAEAQAEDEADVERDVQRHGGRGAGRHGARDALRPEVHAQRLEHGARGQVRERERGVRRGVRRDGGVLPQRHQDGAHVQPQQRDGQRRQEKQQHGALQGQRQQLVVAGPERLRAQRLQPRRQPEQHAVARDVGQPDGQSAARKVQRAQPPQAQHGHHRAQVHHAVESSDRRRHAPQRAQLRSHRRMVVAVVRLPAALRPVMPRQRLARQQDGHAAQRQKGTERPLFLCALAPCERGRQRRWGMACLLLSPLLLASIYLYGISSWGWGGGSCSA
jgi:hypothetical protein